MAIYNRSIAALVAMLALVAGCQSSKVSETAQPTTPPMEAPATPEPSPSPPPESTTPAKQPEVMPAPQADTDSMPTIELQKRLAELGYRPGPLDGVMGPRTINALKRFQRDQKLPPTGKLDAETVARLHGARH